MSWGETRCKFYGESEKPCQPTVEICKRGECELYEYNEKLGPKNPPRLKDDHPFA